MLKKIDTEACKALLISGNADELRRFTDSIKSQPDLVYQFESVFDELSMNDEIALDMPPARQEVFEMVDTSITALQDFMADKPGGQPPTYAKFSHHGDSFTLDIGWFDDRAGDVAWDRIEREVDDPLLQFVEIAYAFDELDYRFEAKKPEAKDPPMYRYHPERFKAFHPSAEAIGKIYRHKVDPKSGMLTLDLMNEMAPAVYGDYNKLALNYPRRWTLNAPSPSLALEAAIDMATAYGRFVQAGRQIMDFPPALVETLRETDVDDIPMNTIKTPYACQYLHFGPQEHLELDPGWLVDGVYVETRGDAGDLRFTVTAVPKDSSLARLWFVHPEPMYTQDFVQDFRTMDLATAIDTVLADRLNALEERRQSSGGDITKQVNTGLAEEGVALPDGTKVVDISNNMAEVRIAQTSRRHEVYKKALQLAVNALCYITAYPDDIDTVWPDGTPDALRIKADSGKGKESARAKSKLAALGYVPVHICGKKIEEQLHVAGIGGHARGPGVATHWRRGHWRNQVHGEGRSLRKLIWVMPMLVGAGKTEAKEDALGHLYLVS